MLLVHAVVTYHHWLAIHTLPASGRRFAGSCMGKTPDLGEWEIALNQQWGRRSRLSLIWRKSAQCTRLMVGKLGTVCDDVNGGCGQGSQ